MTLRTDLMELSVEALTALTNPGFVKRAIKDVAAGALPVLREDPDGTVHARFDDAVQTSMGPGMSLRDAPCTCSASSMCRHRVMLVLAYQASHAGAVDTARQAQDSLPPGWSPASFDDAAIAATVTPQVLAQAQRLALERPTVTVVLAGAAAPVPAAYLPMSQVRFFSSASLALARCDCQQGTGCAHVVVACWAFRQAGRSHPGVAEVTVKAGPPGAEPALDPGGLLALPAASEARAQAEDWLWSLWREGAAQPLPGLEARYEALHSTLSGLGWTWVREDLAAVWDIVQALARRSSRFGMDDLVAASTRLHARLAGAFHADATPAARVPASQILGIGQPGEVALDLLRLVSLGMSCWRDDASDGARIVFADPDTQAACVLEQAWPRDPARPGDSASLHQRRIAGATLAKLAAGQVVTQVARRRANASVELGAQARQTNVLPLTPAAWDDLRAPLRFDTLAALLHYLQGRAPASIRSGEAGGNWHVIGLAGLQLEHAAWDGARQQLSAHWRDSDGLLLRASLGYEAVSPGAVDALARALDGEWGALLAIAGPVRRDHGGVALRPMSILTAQRAVVLALEPTAAHAVQLDGAPPPASANDALLREALHLLGQILRQGLRHAPPSLRARTLAHAAQLEQAGYAQAARLLRGVFADTHDGDRLAPLSALVLLLEKLLA